MGWCGDWLGDWLNVGPRKSCWRARVHDTEWSDWAMTQPHGPQWNGERRCFGGDNRSASASIRRGRATRSPNATLGLAWTDGHGLRWRPCNRGTAYFRKNIYSLVRFLRQFVVLAQPARQEGLGRLLDPLLEQSRNLFAQVGSMIQARKLEALKRGARGLMQVIPRRGDATSGHGRSPGSVPSPLMAGVLTQVLLASQLVLSKFL